MERSAADRVQQEAHRLKNAARYALGHRWVEIGASPKDVIWRRGKIEVWRYHGPGGPPVFICPPLISRSSVLDLYPGNSLVEHLSSSGFSVYLIDWNVPDAVDAKSGLDTYVSRWLRSGVLAALDDSETEAIHLVGYCMGGCLSLLLAAAHPELPIPNLALIATPVDWNEMGARLDPIRAGRLKLDAVVDDTGNVPAATVHSYFRMRRPTSDVVQLVNLWERLADDDYIVGHQAMSIWANEHIPMPGALFRDMVDLWIRQNAFMEGKLRLGPRPVDLKQIKGGILNMLAESDEIVPAAASSPLPELVGSPAPDVVRVPGGHVGLIAGRKAKRGTFPALVDWLNAHPIQT
jgi:polyhydroxyalkanoate synthase